jgi:undecaprenyl-diphosphatase
LQEVPVPTEIFEMGPKGLLPSFKTYHPGKLPWKQCSLAVAVLVTLAIFYLARAFPTFPGDRQALLDFQSLQTGWLDAAALAVSQFGWAPLAVGLVLGVATSLQLQRRRADALMMLLSLVPLAAGNALKGLVDRPRPDYLMLGPVPDSASFPSGHSIYAILFCGLLVALAEQSIKPLLIRRSIQAGLALLVLAVGASRVYMGAHWPSDVIGGYLFGGLALLGLIWLRNWLVNSVPPSFAIEPQSTEPLFHDRLIHIVRAFYHQSKTIPVSTPVLVGGSSVLVAGILSPLLLRVFGEPLTVVNVFTVFGVLFAVPVALYTLAAVGGRQ